MPNIKVNGTHIHYETSGEGEIIIFLHGSGASWRMWEPQIEAFSSSYKMFMIDYRGHGESGKDFPNNKYDYHLITDDVAAFIDTLSLNPVNVVGVSQGGQIATLLAIKRPDIINNLVIADSFSELPSLSSNFVLKISNALFSLLPYSTIINLMMKVYKDYPYTEKILRKSFTIDKKTLLAMKTAPFPTHTHLLHLIKAKTLVMGGGNKFFVGVNEEKASQILFKNISNSTLAIFKNSFDPLSIMEKDIFNDMVIDFFKGKPLKNYDSVDYFLKK
ncbi:alpha/beta fold hydrolase [Bacillus sp. SN10]|uniref:alpha/beta fold hydrolase n=1 Tax=Bacillus sp. SN10 TaxID=2056493 RepID=UPI000C349D69|nr:alpha/beta hydrolase [Bacillus sp. SN10]PKJ55760.1 alpha/beta hydrolase [Bacillus sp. SN10]